MTASLKVKLASETSKAASQRDKIQQLQNELIQVSKLHKLQVLHTSLHDLSISYELYLLHITLPYNTPDQVSELPLCACILNIRVISQMTQKVPQPFILLEISSRLFYICDFFVRVHSFM